LHAWNFISQYDLNGFTVTIQLQDSTTPYPGVYVGDGTYGNTINAPVGTGLIIIRGNSSDQSKVTIIPDTGQECAFGCFEFLGTAFVHFRDLTISDGGKENSLLIEIGCLAVSVKLTDCTFKFVGTTSCGAMYAYNNGNFQFWGTTTIIGNFDYYAWVDPGGHFQQTADWVLVGNPVIRTAFFYLGNFAGVTLDGSPVI
jgi:hypothetical protein